MEEVFADNLTLDDEWADLLLQVRREEELARHRQNLGLPGIIFPQIVKTSFQILLGLTFLYSLIVLTTGDPNIMWLFTYMDNFD